MELPDTRELSAAKAPASRWVG